MNNFRTFNFAALRHARKGVLSLAGIALGFSLSAHLAFAFTQSGVGTFAANGIPMGHEWVTRLAALELLIPGHDPIMPPDPNDPRLHWTKGLAKNLNISSAGAQAEVASIKRSSYADQRYQSTYKPVYDAIVGERWVDIGGFNVAKGKFDSYDCFDAVAQEPVEVQYDHFMRRYDDRGGDGGIHAANGSRERFIQYFVAAATAPKTSVKVWDGGGYAAQTNVDLNFFLFGRAAHLFEDAFSEEHVVRTSQDNFERVRQVKSYLCAAGSEQHSHSTMTVLDYSSGDVIWKKGTGLNPGWPAYKPSNMKNVALVAVEATKDLWAAFIRTLGVPPAQREQAARAEATTLVNNWLGFDEQEMRTWYDNPANRIEAYVLAEGQSGPGQTVPDCMKNLGVASGSQMEKVRQLEHDQRMCLYNVVPEEGYTDLFDRSSHMPYNWKWRNANVWETPPANWQIPDRPADTGVQVKIKSAANGQFMVAADGIGDNQWVYCKPGYEALTFVKVPATMDGIYYRLASDADLFLSYNATTGAVKFWASPTQAAYHVGQVAPGYLAIKSLHWNQYMWLSKESPYITRHGNPANTDSRWIEVQ